MGKFHSGQTSPALTRIAKYAGGAIAIVWLLLTGAGLTAATIASEDPYSFARSILNNTARVAHSEKYLLPANPEMTPAEAGAVLHRITYGDLRPEELKRYGVRAIAAHLPYRAPDSTVVLPDLEATRNHPIAGALLARIPPGFDLASAYRNAYALTVLPDGTDLLTRLSGARRIDLLGARLPSPLPADLSYDDLPIVRPGVFREIAYARKAEIARAIAENRLADADRMSRELITIAFVWYREATTYIELLATGMLHATGIESLAATAAARGDAALADELRAILHAPPESHPLLKKPDNWNERVTSMSSRRLFEVALDPDLPRAVVVEQTMFHHAVRPCYAFPLFSVRQPISEALRPHLVHYESEAQWYEKLTAPQPSRSILDWPQKAYGCARMFGEFWM